MDRLEGMSIALAVAEAGSLSAASRRTAAWAARPATVSRKVSELEAHLRTKLFNRSSRALVPTDAGLSYIAAAKRILADIAEAERVASGEYATPRGDLSISTLVALGRLCLQPILADHEVRYVGEPVAVVVADSAALAEDALDAIALDIETLPAVASRAASRADASLLFEERGSNLVGTLTALRGDADAAFKDAAYVRRERFEVQRFTAVPMEPRGLLAEWDEARGHLTVHGVAKVAFHNRIILAKQMDLAEDAF